MVATPHVLHIHESTPGSWFTRLGAGVLPHGVHAGIGLAPLILLLHLAHWTQLQP